MFNYEHIQTLRKKVQSCPPCESFVPLFDIAEEYHCTDFSELI